VPGQPKEFLSDIPAAHDFLLCGIDSFGEFLLVKCFGEFRIEDVFHHAEFRKYDCQRVVDFMRDTRCHFTHGR